MSIAKVKPFAVEQVSSIYNISYFDVIHDCAAFHRKYSSECAMLQQEAS